MSDRNDCVISLKLTCRQGKKLSLFKVEFLIILKKPKSDLRPFCIQKHGNRLFKLCSDSDKLFQTVFMVLVSSV